MEPAPDPSQTPDPSRLLEQALGRHEQGDLEGAEALYRRLLAEDPTHFVALHQVGLIHNQRGEHEAASHCLSAALQLNPRSALAHFNLAVALRHLGRAEEALAHNQYSLALNPTNPDALLNCAVTLHALQRHEEALARLDKLLALQLHVPDALLNRGIVLQELQRSEEALVSFDRLLALDPNHPGALMNRGNALASLQRPAAALADYDAALALRPGWADALVNRGNALLDLERPQEALVSFDRALAAEPEQVDAVLNRGNALLALGRPREALAAFDRALALRPEFVDALLNRGTALLRVGRCAEALRDYDRAIALRPDSAKAYGNRSYALQLLKRPQEALASCDRALALDPREADAYGNRGSALLNLKRYLEALVAFQRSLEVKPKNYVVLNNQATVLHLLGRHEEAIASARQALAVRPQSPEAHSNLIFCLDYIPELGVAELQEERRRYWQALATSLPTTNPPPSNRRDPTRPLVLGYVSADFFHHSAAYCFGPVLRHHHKEEFVVVCYSGVIFEDDLTAQFRGVADEWRNALLMSDEELAAQIRADGVDILIDLSGHSAGNRLPVFARKPAPIQVTAWGHGGGTGLPAMDYHFTDPVLVPASVRPLYAEASYDLPCCLTFEAPADAPAVLPPPALSQGGVTFGCLNRFAKVTPEVLAVWARILRAVPRSRLLLKDALFADPRERAQVQGLLAGQGIEPGRLELRSLTPRLEHLATYGEVDIVLDTFPQNGGITTWEALWMGPPVVARLGNQLSSRISAAILQALDLGEWVSQDEDAYVALAIRKAADLAGLARFRETIRERIATSPAGNPELYTRAVEAAYRAMWRRWLH